MYGIQPYKSTRKSICLVGLQTTVTVRETTADVDFAAFKSTRTGPGCCLADIGGAQLNGSNGVESGERLTFGATPKRT
jgi:hypothetical protein